MQSASVRLMCHKMAQDAIPRDGGLADGVRFLSSKESIVQGARKAREWVAQAINLIRTAPDPNPWKNATDDEIAAEILRKVELKKEQSKCPKHPFKES